MGILPYSDHEIVSATTDRFWETTALAAMTPEQWESLCDGCAKCCLEKLEDADTGRIHYTNVACKLLDLDTCRCGDYADRARLVPSCITFDAGHAGATPVAPCHLCLPAGGGAPPPTCLASATHRRSRNRAGGRGIRPWVRHQRGRRRSLDTSSGRLGVGCVETPAGYPW